MDGSAHLLSLKVMRVSRPAIASSWEPFYSSSPSFSAHSTASILSLQGATPLPDHPKTLRDLSHATTFLALPPAFGAIQLGETFSACLCLNNDSPQSAVHGVHMRVEMQTATAKTVLAEVGRDPNGGAKEDVSEEVLDIGKTLECLVSHEMKELGQHALACTVTYLRPSPSGRPPSKADLQTFRKFYKFAVTNPLSVKTKVHLPKSPSALMARPEREKVFLEVHIQNLTQEPMWFERMRFECADGWEIDDPLGPSTSPSASASTSTFKNLQLVEEIPEPDAEDPVFEGIMQPQDARQYVYCLMPSAASLSGRVSNFPPSHAPGAIISLGRLDISWRSSFGEPGRLLTSMLSRRIPLLQPIGPSGTPQPPASALPPHLQRSATTANSPSRPRSPQLPQTPHQQQQPPRPPSRPGTPPVSPTPYRPRVNSLTARPQSPSTQKQAIVRPPSTQPPQSLTDLEVDLVVRRVPREEIRVAMPFDVDFTVTLSGLPPPSSIEGADIYPRTPRQEDVPNAPQPDPAKPRRRRRVIQLVAQHLQPARSAPLAQPSKTSAFIRQQPLLPNQPNAQPAATAVATTAGKDSHRSSIPPASNSGFSTPRSMTTTVRNSVASSSSSNLATGLAEKLHGVLIEEPLPIGGPPHRTDTEADGFSGPPLPPPFVDPSDTERKVPPTSGAVYADSSAIFLEPIIFEEDAPTVGAVDGKPRVEVSRDFKMRYRVRKQGFVCIGGVRILVVSDRVVDSAGDEEELKLEDRPWVEGPYVVRMLKEVDVVAELWVRS